LIWKHQQVVAANLRQATFGILHFAIAIRATGREKQDVSIWGEEFFEVFEVFVVL
jgi:hypothetical protein